MVLSVPYITVGGGLLLFHNAWAAMLSYHSVMAAVIITTMYQGFGLSPVRTRDFRVLLIAGLAGLAGGAALYFVWPFLSIDPGFQEHIRGLGLNNQTWIPFLIYFILVNPLLEEYYWRGLLGSGARGIIPRDFAFSGYHVIVIAGLVAPVWLIALFATLALAGWFWRQMGRMGGGLLPPLVSHLAGDAAAILVIWRMATS